MTAEEIRVVNLDDEHIGIVSECAPWLAINKSLETEGTVAILIIQS